KASAPLRCSANSQLDWSAGCQFELRSVQVLAGNLLAARPDWNSLPSSGRLRGDQPAHADCCGWPECRACQSTHSPVQWKRRWRSETYWSQSRTSPEVASRQTRIWWPPAALLPSGVDGRQAELRAQRILADVLRC